MERIEIEHSTAVFLVETDDYATATATDDNDDADDDAEKDLIGLLSCFWIDSSSSSSLFFQS
eukprot:CAMPEP_0170924914 /NCGR_PEP_ID=MMETSP0735-20130129/11967_1 /TAXON_ID=186038 /ORGANISM="Fragilariopsis kerguelensis, Strain L26-C5" /LENGTH=61 /DNA_ID=CAMNT_0011324885 /DNA_START=922 /DNA_END=1103 /DNA_ORIENTATION=-